ncbi:FGGY-family carbohydrate kinase [Microbacterium sp. NC79]|uniref:FGGY-family carbohydrate kinase n=1 Tax=Microbacterium sp. NC79 TaxID=2851009 RepID=UPI001C2BC91C|nr:FGGY family carbohydrate kinase [Microbacterium sp. NC79]MBV0895880.1 sugar kinase [Microbacterium sp. NC79]
MRVTLGFDVGTSSSKGVLVAPDGTIVAQATVAHEVSRPALGHVEHDPAVWWNEFIDVTAQLKAQRPDAEVTAVGVSGMGPCVLLTDADDVPVRPAILYGVDMRAIEQIERMTAELGVDAITATAGSTLTTQAAGPKIVWVADNEPEVYARARRLFMPSSWLARNLTGAYVLDHHSASQSTPLYDVTTQQWHDAWWQRYAPGIEQPQLVWPGEIAGTITAVASAATGLTEGTPVIAGTIDAWTESVSVGAVDPGDLMLMYGTTMFLVATGSEILRTPSMWTTIGAYPGTTNLAGGLATSGALTAWLKDLTDTDYPALLAEAEAAGVGGNGLLMLPYFAGERTPILDPDARGVIAGLTVTHTRGDLYRAALEATAFGVRHNIETVRAAGAHIERIVAVGGGTQGQLWLQIVSDVTGLVQEVPATTIGASYGAAYLAAQAISDDKQSITDWNPVTTRIAPTPDNRADYDDLYAHYLALYTQTKDIQHALARRQHGA